MLIFACCMPTLLILLKDRISCMPTLFILKDRNVHGQKIRPPWHTIISLR